MNTDVVKQFLHFFQDFINLCQVENWPENETTEVEIRNAFVISQHIEKCLDKLQKRGVINEFLAVLNNKEDTTNSLLKYCLADPPKYLLKKIVNANSKICLMDVGFKVFLELFTEEKLERCLTDFLVEAASKETLVKNLKLELSNNKILELECLLFLSVLDSSNNTDLLEILQDFNQDNTELLVVSLLNNQSVHSNARKKLVDMFLSIVLSKDNKYKSFWKSLFKIEDKCFLELCVEHEHIFTCIVEALLDSGKLLRENLSVESFYIDLSYSELARVVQNICSNKDLKIKFFELVHDYDTDRIFWENIL